MLAPFWISNSIPETLGHKKVDFRCLTFHTFSIVLDLRGCPGIAKIELRTPSPNRYYFCIVYSKNDPIMDPKRHNCVGKTAPKNQFKNERYNGTKRNQKTKCCQNDLRKRTKINRNRPLGLQGAVGDSWGSPWLRPGRPRHQNEIKMQ